ncbi:MAG: DUF427 domain-containing protein [Myxococcota bacterium]
MSDSLPDWARRGRASWTNRGQVRPAFADTPAEGQESVWDYPRPPALVPDDRRIRVIFAGEELADTRSALRLLETSHPPTFYLPREDVNMALLREAGQGSRCEWKGTATYYDAVQGNLTGPFSASRQLAWSYLDPFGDYTPLAGHLAFYASRAECYVGDERARPQPGGFYGGWITSELAGPFKGDPGSGAW